MGERRVTVCVCEILYEYILSYMNVMKLSAWEELRKKKNAGKVFDRHDEKSNEKRCTEK